MNDRPALAPSDAPGAVRSPEHSARVLLGVLLAWTLASALLLLAPLSGRNGAGPVALELAADAGAFAKALGDDWRQAGPPDCEILAPFLASGGCLKRLRTQLMVDSVGLVPGYVGLLLYLMLALGRAARLQRGLWLHLACVPALAAGLFDIAENGMTGRAAQDLLQFVLADETVRDVRVASLVKWSCLATAFALLALLSLLAGLRDRETPVRPRWLLPLGGALAAVAAVTLALGVFGPRVALNLAFGPMALAYALLAAWRLRHTARLSTPPPVPGSAPSPPPHPAPPADPPAA